MSDDARGVQRPGDSSSPAAGDAERPTQRGTVRAFAAFLAGRMGNGHVIDLRSADGAVAAVTDADLSGSVVVCAGLAGPRRDRGLWETLRRAARLSAALIIAHDASHS